MQALLTAVPAFYCTILSFKLEFPISRTRTIVLYHLLRRKVNAVFDVASFSFALIISRSITYDRRQNFR